MTTTPNTPIPREAPTPASTPDEGYGASARRLGLLTTLYVSQGLPFGFFTQALPVLLRARGVSLEHIGLSSMLALPWALKFLWAPLVDSHALPGVGARRSWILPMQALTVIVLGATAFAEPTTSFRGFVLAIFVVNLLSATQDIATDGLAVDMLAPGERGLANGLQVAGYRAGMIVSGGVLLVFFERIGWTRTFLTMAALVALMSVPIVLHREPSSAAREGARVGHVGLGAKEPGTNFFKRPYAARVLGLLAIYKFGDAFAVAMFKPFLTDAGFTLADVGYMVGTVGFVAGLLGALTGGALVPRLGRRRALVVFAFLQALTVLGYAYAAYLAPVDGNARGHVSPELLYALSGAEHFAAGMATAALFTAMMDFTEPRTAATDYTLQASVVVVATGLANVASGYSAHALGYAPHFLFAGVLAILAPVAIATLFPENPGATTSP